MWKRLEDSISINEKLARLSWPTLGTWMYLLVNTDAKGRYHADSRIVKARCMTMRYDVRLELVDEALAELVTEKLIHRYDVDGKPYLVLHDYDQHQPTGALRYVDAKFPEPPAGSIKCKCLEPKEPKDGAKRGANAPPSLSLSLSLSPSLSDSQSSSPDRSDPSGLLATGYCNKNKGVISFEKCKSLCDFYLAGGMDFKAAEQAIWNSSKGQKVWEILDPLRPKGGNQMPTMDEIIKSASKVGAK